MYVESIAIEYITKSVNDTEILTIGGIHPNGVPWKLSVSRAIAAIEEGKWKFHINYNGIDKKVVVRKSFRNKKSLSILNGSDSIFYTLPQFPSVL